MAKNQKYRVHGVLSVVVGGGEQMKPGKDGLFELTAQEAEHLATVYRVEDAETGRVIGDGSANTGAKRQSTITKESLMALTNQDLDEKLKVLGLKADADASKGDKAEKVLRFLDGLDKAAEKGK